MIQVNIQSSQIEEALLRLEPIKTPRKIFPKKMKSQIQRMTTRKHRKVLLRRRTLQRSALQLLQRRQMPREVLIEGHARILPSLWEMVGFEKIRQVMVLILLRRDRHLLD